MACVGLTAHVVPNHCHRASLRWCRHWRRLWRVWVHVCVYNSTGTMVALALALRTRSVCVWGKVRHLVTQHLQTTY